LSPKYTGLIPPEAHIIGELDKSQSAQEGNKKCKPIKQNDTGARAIERLKKKIEILSNGKETSGLGLLDPLTRYAERDPVAQICH